MSKPFKNQVEIYEYLQVDPTYMVKRNIDSFPDVVILINGNACWYPDGKEPVHFANPNAWEPFVQPKWYENLKEKRPNGVLCKVWNEESEDEIFEPEPDYETSKNCNVNYALINDTIHYENPGLQFMDVTGICWNNAEPVIDTNNLFQYLLNNI